MTHTGYMCAGPVCGNCGHKHRSLSGAYRCFRRDAIACVQQGGYTDRRVYHLDGSELEDYEAEELDRMICADRPVNPRLNPRRWRR